MFVYYKGVREHCDKFLREFGEVPIISTSAVTTDASAYIYPNTRSSVLPAIVNLSALQLSPSAYDQKYKPEGIDR